MTPSATPATRQNTTTDWTGDDRANFIRANGKALLLKGGKGDDTYAVYGAERVIEQPGEGTDTVTGPIGRMPDNVENATLDRGGRVIGNVENNLITGPSNGDAWQVWGGPGLDLIRIGEGACVVTGAPGDGGMIVEGFRLGTDILRLHYGLSPKELLAGSYRDGDDTVIELPHLADFVRLVGVAELDETAFPRWLDTTGYRPQFTETFRTLSVYDEAAKTGIWRPEYGHGGAGTIGSRTLNDEIQYFDKRMMVATDDGLRIHARPMTAAERAEMMALARNDADLALAKRLTWMSSMASAKFHEPAYIRRGLVIAEMTIPHGKGLWPAFWLLPWGTPKPPEWPAGGELDPMESLGDRNVVHVNGHWVENGKHVGKGGYVLIPGDGRYFIAAEITDDEIAYYYDGWEVLRFPMPPSLADRNWYPLFNLSVGGQWAGAPDETTPKPSILGVHGFTTYTKTPAPSLPPPVPPAIEHGTLIIGGKTYDVIPRQ